MSEQSTFPSAAGMAWETSKPQKDEQPFTFQAGSQREHCGRAQTLSCTRLT